MGIDHRRESKHHSKAKKVLISKNMYMKLLVKLFKFLVRRAGQPFHKAILRRLMLSRVHRPPMSISRICRLAKDKTKTVVVVATVTDDERLLEVPKMNICALKFTLAAKERIEKAGGVAMTLDQLIMKNPKGSDTLLLRAPHKREALTHFGRGAGLPGSHTRPYAAGRGRNHEAPSKDKLR